MLTDELAARNVEIVCRGQRETVDVLGIWCEWKTTEAETNHHYSVMEMIVPPGAGYRCTAMRFRKRSRCWTARPSSVALERMARNGVRSQLGMS